MKNSELFQSTHPRGLRLNAVINATPQTLFQSTHPRGLRLSSKNIRRYYFMISIHTSIRDATTIINKSHCTKTIYLMQSAYFINKRFCYRLFYTNLGSKRYPILVRMPRQFSVYYCFALVPSNDIWAKFLKSKRKNHYFSRVLQTFKKYNLQFLLLFGFPVHIYNRWLK